MKQKIDPAREELLAKAHADYHAARMALEAMARGLEQAQVANGDLLALMSTLQRIDEEVVVAYGNLVLDRHPL